MSNNSDPIPALKLSQRPIELERPQNAHSSHPAKGQIDVEAPTPRQLIREGASNQGTNDCATSEGAADQASDQWPLRWGQRLRQSSGCAGEDARSAQSGYCSTDDQHLRRGGCSG